MNNNYIVGITSGVVAAFTLQSNISFADDALRNQVAQIYVIDGEKVHQSMEAYKEVLKEFERFRSELMEILKKNSDVIEADYKKKFGSTDYKDLSESQREECKSLIKKLQDLQLDFKKSEEEKLDYLFKILARERAAIIKKTLVKNGIDEKNAIILDIKNSSVIYFSSVLDITEDVTKIAKVTPFTLPKQSAVKLRSASSSPAGTKAVKK